MFRSIWTGLRQRVKQRQRVKPVVATLERLEERIVLSSWSGAIPDGTVWASGQVQQIVGNARVPFGATLTIQPGAIVKFNQFSNIGLSVDGKLLAQGTTGQPIYFTSLRDDTVGGDTMGDGQQVLVNGEWNAVSFGSTSTGSLLDHVEVRYGGSAGVGAVVVDGGQLTLTNSLLQASSSAGIRIKNSNPTLTNVSFRNDVTAASMDLNSRPVISGVTMTNNGINGLELEGGILAQGGVWNNPDITYVIRDQISIPIGQTLTVSPGQIVKFRDFQNVGLHVDGTLNAVGSAVAPVVFTSTRDDAIGTDVYNDGTISREVGPGQWTALSFGVSSVGSVLDHVEVRYGGSNGIGAVILDGGQLALTNSLLQSSGSAGIRIKNSNPTLTDVSFQDNVTAASMDMFSNPAIRGVTMTNNGVNALQLDGGTLDNGGVWDDPDITYLIRDRTAVPIDQTLTIGAGQIVKFRDFGNFGLDVNGTLNAAGVAGAPIYFTSARDDSIGTDVYNDGIEARPPGSGQWTALAFSNDSIGNVLDHVEVRYSGSTDIASVIVDGGQMAITNSVVRDSFGGAIILRHGAELELANSLRVRNRHSGLRVETGATATAVNNTIDGNTRGIEVDGVGASVTLINNLITNNALSGIFVTNRGFASVRANDVFNPGAIEGNYRGAFDLADLVNSLSIDPGYVNRTELDYHLLSTSLVIDAATSDNAPIDDFDFNLRVDDLAVPNAGTGQSPFFDMGAFEFGGTPRAVAHSPVGNVTDAVSKVLFTFRTAMNTSSFSPGADVVSFTGPNGAIAVTGFQWINCYQLEVSFSQQSKGGGYQLVTGPNILDASGKLLDIDGDGLWGENLDDRYSATWTIVPPKVVSQSPQDFAPAPMDHLSLTFDRPMNQASFSPSDDIVSFQGPNGSIAVTGFTWSDARTLRISFNTQTTLGVYTLILGANISDLGGNLLDQSGNRVGGEVADRYTASLTLANISFVSGAVSQNTTWSGLVIVDDTVTVQAGATLTVAPGTIIKIRDLKGITVQAGGSFLANGTNVQPITMTSIHDDSIGGDSERNGSRILPKPGDWISLEVNGGTAHLESTHVRSGGGSFSDAWSNSGMIRTTENATVEISRSVLSDAYYDGVLAQGGTMTITNSVLRGSDRGVVSWGNAVQVQITNSTIVENRLGMLGHGGTLNVVNCIISENLEVGIDHDQGFNPTVSYSNIFNPLGLNTRGFVDPLGGNGNVSVDPRFINSAASDYRLRPFSLAIDAANGSAAPITDLAGAPRSDDPQTANTGTPTAGNSFADMGAFEFIGNAVSDLDLIVTGVSGPATALEGDSVTVQWTTKNIGTGLAGGDWHDSVYLSADPIWTPDDILLGEALHNGNLGATQSDSMTANLTVPGVLPGTYFFLVRANSDDALFEGQNLTNNVTPATTTVTLDVPTLTIGTSSTGHLAATGDSKVYKLVVPQNSDVFVSLDGANGTSNELFLKRSELPTRQQFGPGDHHHSGQRFRREFASAINRQRASND